MNRQDPSTPAAPRTTVFRHVRPLGGAPVDLVVVDGVIARDPAAAAHAAADVESVDCGGRLALPTLVDAHIHPDKTSWGEAWHSRRPAPGGIADYVAQDVELNRSLPTPVAERALRLLSHAAALGTRGVRAQVDVAPAYGLEGLEGVRAAGKSLAGVADVQVVAFPQHGVRRAPGTAELLEEAARTGLIDFVGGIDPMGFDSASDDPTSQLDTVFGIAERHRVGVDVHLHDQGERGLAPLREIVARTRALDMGGRVTVSHAFCVPGTEGAEFDRIADELGEAGVSLTTVAPDTTRVLPLARLRRHGVRVGIGSDGVRDAWSPYGNADMLHRAHLLGFCLNARLDEELEDCYLTAAHDGAALLGLPPADFSPGAPADFLLVDAECLAQVVVDMPRRDLVVRAGRVVARDGRLVGA
ncbi:amidohydrolase [Streptomyces sp. NPDC050504]|uniref:amidohydrolase n=1 Tax=Streptomyces sp. NPDC050504 TaxID=3365618 RepID=UPI0037AA0C51